MLRVVEQTWLGSLEYVQTEIKEEFNANFAKIL